MANYRAKLEEYEKLLHSDRIGYKALEELCFTGCPHEKGVRALCWKILLNYLPTNKSEWVNVLQSRRKTYQDFIDDMIIKPGAKAYGKDRTDVTFEDHPLNPNPDSQWKAYFEDNDMLLQIDKDCRRLCPDLNFFQSPTEYPCKAVVDKTANIENLRKRVENSALQAQTVGKNWCGTTNLVSNRKKKQFDEYTVLLEEGQEAHWEVVERILFIYGKLNPGLKYIQGMNEILGPIYYTFASDPNKEWKEHAEADAFYCFTSLMAEFRDNFIKTLDDSDCGIGAMMHKFMLMLKQKDPLLYQRFAEQDMKPQFYAFRWITLMLSQEFPLPDVLRLWDSFFADPDRFNFLLCVCCAMLMLVRDSLLKNDFSHNMKLVQNYPSMDIHQILAKAVHINTSR